jgi:hypothetical protein
MERGEQLALRARDLLQRLVHVHGHANRRAPVGDGIA